MRDEYYAEAQKLHAMLFVAYFSAHNEAAMRYHIKNVVSIAYEQEPVNEMGFALGKKA